MKECKVDKITHNNNTFCITVTFSEQSESEEFHFTIPDNEKELVNPAPWIKLENKIGAGYLRAIECAILKHTMQITSDLVDKISQIYDRYKNTEYRIADFIMTLNWCKSAKDMLEKINTELSAITFEKNTGWFFSDTVTLTIAENKTNNITTLTFEPTSYNAELARDKNALITFVKETGLSNFKIIARIANMCEAKMAGDVVQQIAKIYAKSWRRESSSLNQLTSESSTYSLSSEDPFEKFIGELDQCQSSQRALEIIRVSSIEMEIEPPKSLQERQQHFNPSVSLYG